MIRSVTKGRRVIPFRVVERKNLAQGSSSHPLLPSTLSLNNPSPHYLDPLFLCLSPMKTEVGRPLTTPVTPNSESRQG